MCIVYLNVLLKSLVSLSNTVVLRVGTPVMGRFQQSLERDSVCVSGSCTLFPMGRMFYRIRMYNRRV